MRTYIGTAQRRGKSEFQALATAALLRAGKTVAVISTEGCDIRRKVGPFILIERAKPPEQYKPRTFVFWDEYA